MLHTSVHVSLDLVVHAVITALDDPGWEFQTAHIRHMPWNVLYFLTFSRGQQTQQYVAKIGRYPDQDRAEVSWESEELLARGRCEYACLEAVYRHFQNQSSPFLSSVRPVAYIPAQNIILMAYVDGAQLYNKALRPHHLLIPARRRRAHDLMKRSGEWLRHLHRLQYRHDFMQRYTLEDAVFMLEEQAQTLHRYGVALTARPGWKEITSRFRNIRAAEPVLCHGDFHPRNLLLTPDGALVGYDTALERIDSPYYDIGKYFAEIKALRDRVIIFRGYLPTSKMVRSLSKAFLDGYFKDGRPDALQLALYEGIFILEKWVYYLERLAETAPGAQTQRASLLNQIVVNRTLERIFRNWQRDITLRAE